MSDLSLMLAEVATRMETLEAENAKLRACIDRQKDEREAYRLEANRLQAELAEMRGRCCKTCHSWSFAPLLYAPDVGLCASTDSYQSPDFMCSYWFPKEEAHP